MVDQRIAYRPDEALEVLPVGRTLFYELLRSGAIPSFKIGKARFIPRQKPRRLRRAGDQGAERSGGLTGGMNPEVQRGGPAGHLSRSRVRHRPGIRDPFYGGPTGHHLRLATSP